MGFSDVRQVDLLLLFVVFVRHGGDVIVCRCGIDSCRRVVEVMKMSRLMELVAGRMKG